MSDFDDPRGALCLGLANTWGNRGDATSDTLRSYDDVLRWARGAGVVDGPEARQLAELAAREPEEAARVLERTLVLREGLYRSCAAVAAGRAAEAEDLELLNRELALLPPARLCCGGPCCEWRWPDTGPRLAQLLWPVVRSAAGLLTSEDAARIRECAAPDCNWLFLDRSRNRSRRWCDMGSCGNRAKARRYYRRHQAGA